MDISRCLEILDVGPDASPDEVRQVYKDLVHVWHPDRFVYNPRLRKKAEEKLRQVNAAYEAVVGPNRQRAQGGRAKKLDDRRRHPRVNRELPLNHATRDRRFSSIRDRILDLSAGGVFISTTEPFRLGQHVSISFTLPGFGELLDIGGKIVRQGPEGVGVEFRISPSYKKFLANFF